MKRYEEMPWGGMSPNQRIGEWCKYADVLAFVRRCYALIAKAERRGYERGLAEGRRREQQVHREMYYADYWNPKQLKEVSNV